MKCKIRLDQGFFRILDVLPVSVPSVRSLFLHGLWFLIKLSLSLSLFLSRPAVGTRACRHFKSFHMALVDGAVSRQC